MEPIPDIEVSDEALARVRAMPPMSPESLQRIARRWAEARSERARRAATASPARSGSGAGQDADMESVADGISAETARRVLDLPLQRNDVDASTIREYLIAIVRRVWIQNECFSGNRPFGNSDWEYDLYEPLIAASLIRGELDEFHSIVDCDWEAGNRFILAAIDQL